MPQLLMLPGDARPERAGVLLRNPACADPAAGSRA
jgi:hypothetical protein